MSKKTSKNKKSSKSRKAIKMYKNISSSSLTVTCERNDRIEHTTTDFRLAGNLIKYINVADIFGGDTTFTEMAVRFSMYRINGLKIEMRSVFEPAASTHIDHQVAYIGFFPSVTGSYIGSTQVQNYDKSVIASTNQVLMSRKQTFYQNFFEGSGAGGYGTWNSISSYSQIPGSLQIAVASPRGAFLGTASLYHIRLIFSVTFKEKQLTG